MATDWSRYASPKETRNRALRSDPLDNAVLALGVGASGPDAETMRDADDVQKKSTRPLLIASLVLAAGAVLSVVDYWRVVVIFTPGGEDNLPLQTRVARGQRSVFFSHHADYAAATTPGLTSVVDPFKRSSHYLLDTRLMIAWAKAYALRGDVERARYLAARLREFRNPDANEFFAECDAPVVAGQHRPFQCDPPTRSFVYSDFK